MKRFIIPIAALLSAGAITATMAESSGKVLPSLGVKMIGTWKGQTGCAGNFVFRADGAYELTGYGPAASDSSGAWKLRGDSLPAKLVLACTKSDLDEEVGTTIEVMLIRLDDGNLAVRRGNQVLDSYTRARK